MVRFWYPALRIAACTPAEYSSPKVWVYLSHLLGLPSLRVRTNSCRQAAVMPGAHPVILASHGYTGMFTDYTFLFEDLASRDYVIASIAHTYETSAVEFPDERLATSVFGTHFVEETLRTDEQSLRFAASVRLRDLKFVAAELNRLNAGGSPFTGKLDLGQIAVLGHSMGSDTAMASLRQQFALRAAVLLDPVVLSAMSIRGSDKPVFLVSEGREEWSESECALWGNLRGPRVGVTFRGADHLTPSDAVWLGLYVAAIHVESGMMGPEKTVKALRSYVAAFFDAYLSGKQSGLLLNGLSAEYADAVVTTRTERLCAEPPRPMQQAALEP
jgi:Chlorophyllase enzyme